MKKLSLTTLLILVLAGPLVAAGDEAVVQSGSLTLRAEQREHAVNVTITDARGVRYADGPVVYEIETSDGRLLLEPRLVDVSTQGISIRAGSSGIELTHDITPRPDGFVERITVSNHSEKPIQIRDYCFSLQRKSNGASSLRTVAVPFRRQADGLLRDWSLEELAAGKAANSDWRNDPAVIPPEIVDSTRGRLRSEGWILTDGRSGLLVAKYSQEHIEYSMLAWHRAADAALRLGGSSFALHREPDSMQQLSPGQTVKLGATYYLAVAGGWPAGYERFRKLLSELGHALPAGYDPPVNWNELFDVGWYHSDSKALAQHYTKDALLQEAAKAAEVGATALYLDPGWEVCEGTTLWDASRLGPAADLIRTLGQRFKLGLAFRTIGRVYRDEFPHGWYVQHAPATRPAESIVKYERPCANPVPASEPVPVSDERGARDLALLPAARAGASSCLPGFVIHQIAHLNDGWYGNSASWISAGEPSWAQIDLGDVYTVDRIRLGSEHSPHFRDRTPVHIHVLVATQYAPDSDARTWQLVAENVKEPIAATREFAFTACPARWVRIEILTSTGGNARVDEIEVYETEPHPWPTPPQRRALGTTTAPCAPIAFWEVCTQAPEWQREKAARIERVAALGMRFAMFDEFDWRGPCYASNHGHPVPSTPESHTRAVYGLIQKVKQRVPELLVEAHDPVWPWGVRYLPIYFDQGRSYDENWGFEFMWNPIEDLISGRALCLYYYNLACDIPLYDHITAEKDNDACLAFWWYASTVRHLGIGGKKGLDSKQENAARWTAYKRAMQRYMKLREWFVRGRFIGLDELTHLHVLPGRRGGVLVAFNLTDHPVDRQITLQPRDLGLAEGGPLPAVDSARAEWHEGQLALSFTIPAQSPRIVEIATAAAEPTTQAARSLPTIEWDKSTLQLIASRGDYGRMVRLRGSSIACVYDCANKIWIRHSLDDGKSWKDPILVAEAENCWLTNADLLPLQDGTLLYFWNERPLEATTRHGWKRPPDRLTRPFLIRMARSRNLGRTWSRPQTLHIAGVSFDNGCWEPVGLQLPSGEIQVYFSNESSFPTTSEQEIALLRSKDGGETWTKPERIGFRKDHRDGMPVPLLLAGGRGIAVAIEDNGYSGERFKPSILHTTLADNWRSGAVTGDSPHRWGALAEPLDPAWYGGGPCLQQLPSGETLLSYQENPDGTLNRCRMAVCIGDPGARHFTNKTYPLPLGPRGNQAWNSLFVKNARTVVAISTATIDGVRGIWAIEGRLTVPDSRPTQRRGN